ncbi:NADP-dependent oxidoreductase [Rhizobium sp. SL86]|uniref:NADP-dependent oxidoreductase n=1 Tax=Rhizobium sp. SL86 TaxID=2995148 RepID=UPI00227475C8|nr:NADP-dependent oxidoreductase [Rhizobium sp. SL86]MCY1667526.1 NADP-dependent oxidoreductase [Rhizobium sp. SL86]
MIPVRICFYRDYGGPDVLEFGDVDAPRPEAGQVLVRMAAASLTPFDCKLRAGGLKAYFSPAFPNTPGRDGTGTVVALGPGVGTVQIGDRVCVMTPGTRAPGTCSELLACDIGLVVPLPDALSIVEGASLVNASLSAWTCAVRVAGVKAGDKVLVHAGAGAVGGLLVQLCRHLGADVTATCRSTNKDYVLSLGAGKAIAYDQDEFTTLEPQDIVFDLMGADVHARSYQVLKRDGHLVYLTAAPIVDRGAEFGVTVTRAMIVDDPEAVAPILALAANGKIKPQVARTLPLSEVAQAHRLMEAGEVTRGRLVLTI